ncbi:hypothetical protein FL966_10060 [Caproiciproducens galactitolivorans]|uniref:Uncharacterized protein n=1 Tax=Caproiciproducens galactitolivorans TaxID=642589 RepID=A0A4Z0XZZ7_9FIRM|nr:hypothetical protein [Caproiciproducens galactitolivorans]QEY35363.1 hypothetical protein FL966_10060 [Caproiciproducens galactitolivorans]TGJ77064.1 hypothetical protein CAGA_11400 [Caproiciproducens galactitolivorans]
MSFALVIAIILSCNIEAFAAQKNNVNPLTSKSEVKASGKKYGPWFGGHSDTYSTRDEYNITITLVRAIADAIVTFVDEPKARALAAAVSGSLANVNLSTADYTYGTVYKRYREVYVGGEFAYYQNEVTVDAYYCHNGKKSHVGKTTEIFEGSVLMIAKQ